MVTYESVSWCVYAAAGVYLYRRLQMCAFLFGVCVCVCLCVCVCVCVQTWGYFWDHSCFSPFMSHCGTRRAASVNG